MSASNPSVSLIVATVGRRNEVARLFESLTLQSERSFEVIVADQNPDGFLDDLVARFGSLFAIRHLRTPRGLSRARNAGLAVARGDVVAFPDDDSWYDADVLLGVLARFRAAPEVSGFTGVSRDDRDNPSAGRFDATPGRITRKNVWRRGISFTIFVRRGLCEALGGFDECLGLGASSRWQSGEETDFLLRALAAGFHLEFDPSLVVRHPQALGKFGDERRRAVPYSRGYMRVLRVHGYPLTTQLARSLIPLAGSVAHLVLGRAREARLSYWTGVGRLGELLRPSKLPSGTVTRS